MFALRMSQKVCSDFDLVKFYKKIYETATAESQADSSFPVDCHQAILNKAKTSKTNRKGTDKDNGIRHNIGTTFERSVINVITFHTYFLSPDWLRAHHVLPNKY